MKHYHKSSKQTFEIGFVEEFDITLITRWNSAESEAHLSPITLVGYYFGEYDEEATNHYIDRWISDNDKNVKVLQAAIKYIEAYLVVNGELCTLEECDYMKQAITDARELLQVKKLLTKNETELELEILKDYKKWFDELLGQGATEKSIEELYDSKIEITVAGKSVALNFDAETYNNVGIVLKRAIEEF